MKKKIFYTLFFTILLYQFLYSIDRRKYLNIFNKIDESNAINNIESFLSEGGDINSINGDGNTLLIEASKKGYYDIVEYLIKNNADINYKNKENKTALMYATDYIYILKLLVENKADTNIEDEEGKTALFFACEKGNLETVKYLISIGSKVDKISALNRTILMYGASSDNLELVAYLVEDIKMNSNQKDEWNQNPLFFTKSVDVARYLISKNADPNIQNIIGWSVLDIAKYSGNKRLVDYFTSINVKSYIQ